MILEMNNVMTSAALGTQSAIAMIGRALDMANEGVCVSVAVLDAGWGQLLAFGRGEKAAWATIGIAQDKAYTAAGFGASTQELGAQASSDVAWRRYPDQGRQFSYQCYWRLGRTDRRV